MARIAILTGDTFRFRDRLKSEWKWSAGRKAWTRIIGDGDTAEQVMSRHVRMLPGIRNRGEFFIAIEEETTT